MKLKTNPAVVAAQKAAAKVHEGGAYKMKNGKAYKDVGLTGNAGAVVSETVLIDQTKAKLAHNTK